MNVSFEQLTASFTFPDILAESGEFDRVAQTFGIESSVLQWAAGEGELTSLTEDIWKELTNTDSNRLAIGDWQAVEQNASQQEVVRDWKSLQMALEESRSLDAPIVMKIGDLYHLVAGNTRLMVAKAAGVTPRVLLFSVEAPT